jgi:hypothetical protein
MRYCPDCGTPHECEGQAAAIDREVEIERLRTRRDIEVARITASAARDIAETEAESDVARAEGEVDGMETALDALAGGGETDSGEGAPIVVDTTPEPEPEIDEEPDSAPPVIDVATPRESKRGGYWGNYK